MLSPPTINGLRVNIKNKEERHYSFGFFGDSVLVLANSVFILCSVRFCVCMYFKTKYMYFKIIYKNKNIYTCIYIYISMYFERVHVCV